MGLDQKRLWFLPEKRFFHAKRFFNALKIWHRETSIISSTIDKHDPIVLRHFVFLGEHFQKLIDRFLKYIYGLKLELVRGRIGFSWILCKIESLWLSKYPTLKQTWSSLPPLSPPSLNQIYIRRSLAISSYTDNF